MEQLDFCIEYLNNLTEFQNKMNQLHKEIKILLPIMIRPFASKKILPFLVCNVDRKKINNIEEPVFCFSYVSPAGRSGRYYEIEITSSLLKRIQAEISTKLGKSGHIKTQRSAMTNDLREAIKKRDNYTCCICGNSVLNEPNLLLEVDHIIPVSKGGVTEASNLQTLCWRCNRAKSDK